MVKKFLQTFLLSALIFTGTEVIVNAEPTAADVYPWYTPSNEIVLTPPDYQRGLKMGHGPAVNPHTGKYYEAYP